MGYLRLEEIMEILGTQPPGTPMELSNLCEWMHILVKRHGQEWVSENKERILEEWKFILDFDL